MGETKGVAPDAVEAAEGLTHDDAVGASEAMTTPIDKRTTSPAFQFYPKDFLSSSKVQRMSLTEIGAYTLLLSHCWLDGSLPADVDQLARIVKLPANRFRRLWAGPLHECFYECEGTFVNARLNAERVKQAGFRRRQSDNGKQGGRPRKQKPEESQTKGLGFSGLTKTKAKKSSPISYLLSPDKKDIEREADEPFSAIDLDAELTVDCQALWMALIADYPSQRVTTDRPTQDAFIAALGPDAERGDRFDLMLQTLTEHKASEQWTRGVIPNLSTWLKRGDWQGTRKLKAAPTGTDGRGRTGAPPRGKYDGIEKA